MKKLIVVTMVIIFTICSCAKKENSVETGTIKTTENSTVKADTSDNNETGYPSGNIQRTYVFYNNQLYEYNTVCKDVDSEADIQKYYKGYKAIDGKLKILTDKMPNSELEATCISENAKLYTLDNKVILYSDNRIMELDKQ